MTRKLAGEYVTRHLRGTRVFGSAQEIVAAAGAPVIGTHNGTFHCDEAMACGLLKCCPQFNSMNILRTRDPTALEQCPVVVDVGTVYDPDALRFDHHQPSFHGTMTTSKKTYKTRLSSAGLVYKHFGRDIIQQYVKFALVSPHREELLAMCCWDANKNELSGNELENVFDVIYRNFVEHIDGIDNGVNAYGPPNNTESDESACVRNYSVTSTLSDRVGSLAAWWNEADNGKIESENASFLEAMDLATREFFHAVHYYAFAWMPARGIVENTFLSAGDIHPSGRIVVLRDRFCPWKDHLMELEEEHGKVGHVLYVLFADKSTWRIQAVPKEISGFESRYPLPWRGLRDEELSKGSGIEGCVFVHVSGFIGGNKSYEGALQMAMKALAEFESDTKDLKRKRDNEE